MLTRDHHYLFLLLISLIWGSQFIFTTVLLTEYTPLQIAMLRAFIGAIFLTGVVLYLKEKQECDGSTWMKLAFISIFEAVIPFVFVSFALKTVSIGTTALLLATTPIFTFCLEAFINGKMKFGMQKFVGVLIGFGAIAALFWKDIQHGQLLMHRTGEIAILLSALSIALGLVLITKLSHRTSPFVAARNILAVAGVILLGLVGLKGHYPVMSHSFNFNVSLLFLGAFCSGAVYVLYIRLISSAGATFASLSKFLVPVVGILTGMFFAHEMITKEIVGVLALLILSIVLVEERLPWLNKLFCPSPQSCNTTPPKKSRKK
jgi:drug/metabolite transporter (DMT)-like permease